MATKNQIKVGNPKLNVGNPKQGTCLTVIKSHLEPVFDLNQSGQFRGDLSLASVTLLLALVAASFWLRHVRRHDVVPSAVGRKMGVLNRCRSRDRIRATRIRVAEIVSQLLKLVGRQVVVVVQHVVVRRSAGALAKRRHNQ